MSHFPTLSEFFRDTYTLLRIDQPGLDKKTRASYQESVNWWCKLTTDPPIDQITDKMIAQFMKDLATQRGKKRGTTMAINSLRKHATSLDTILKLTGPRSRQNKYGQGLLPNPPFVEGPRAEIEAEDKNWTLDEVRRMYANAGAAAGPEIDGIPVADWWRTLIVVEWYTGLRITSLMRMEFRRIRDCYVTIPAADAKGGKGIKKYLPSLALEHIERIRTDGRSLVLGWDLWDSQRRVGYDNLRLIQAAAGIPEDRRWGFHSFRKTHSTYLSGERDEIEDGVELAQASLGHADKSLTKGVYISGSAQERRLAAAIDRMPSPLPQVELDKPTPEPERERPRDAMTRIVDDARRDVDWL